MHESTLRLEALLENADPEDIKVLINYNYGDDRQATIPELVETIRANGSNDISKWLLGKVEYLNIVRDVAHKFKIEWAEKDSETHLEEKILTKILQQSWLKMSDKEKDAIHDLFGSCGVDKARLSKALVEGSFREFLPAVGYIVIVNVARLAATAVAKDAGVLAAESLLLQGLAAELLGPLGIVAGVVILLTGLAGPAYRKIIPTVIQIAYIRRKADVKNAGSV